MMQVRIGNKLYSSDPKRPKGSMMTRIAAAPGWFKWPALAYVVAALVYAIYSEETQTGLIGYFMAIELEHLGSTSGGRDVAFALVLLLLPLLIVMAVLGRFTPQLLEPVGSAGFMQAAYPRSWKKIFGITAIPLALTGIAVVIVYFVAQQNLREARHAVNLEDVNAPLQNKASYVTVTGLVARRYLASYRYGNHTHANDYVYVPLTNAGWTPADPVRIVVHRTVAVDDWDKPFQMPFDLSQRLPLRIQGKISRSLPVLIQREFNDKGLKFAPTWFVVDEVAFPNADWALIAPAVTGIVGVMLSFFVLYIMTLLRFRACKTTARAAGA